MRTRLEGDLRLELQMEVRHARSGRLVLRLDGRDFELREGQIATVRTSVNVTPDDTTIMDADIVEAPALTTGRSRGWLGR